jgi:hypothetical protein
MSVRRRRQQHQPEKYPRRAALQAGYDLRPARQETARVIERDVAPLAAFWAGFTTSSNFSLLISTDTI